MEIRLVKISEIDQVMEIIKDAKKYLSFQSEQWQQGYPYESTMINDINNKYLYGLYIENKLIVIAALIKGAEPTYINMIEGKWIKEVSDNDLVIHRIAIKEEYRGHGYASKLMKFAIDKSKQENISSIKVDTHKANKDMQKLLTNTGFIYTGIISLDRGEVDQLRLTYELDL